MEHQFRAVVYFKRQPLNKRLELPIRNDLGLARQDAEAHLNNKQVKGVQILRADTQGLNKGVFFLHLIVK